MREREGRRRNRYQEPLLRPSPISAAASSLLSQTPGLHLSSANTSASPSSRLLLDPRAHRGLLVFSLVTVLEEVVSRLVSITVVLRVALLAVVVWFVLRAH